MREIALLLWALGLFLGVNNAIALPITAELSPEVVRFFKEEKDYKVVVSGKVDKSINLLAKVKGPERSYRVIEKEKQYGIWTSAPPKFVYNISSYCQVFAFKDTQQLVVSNSLKNLESYSENFLCNNTHKSAEKAVIDKLSKLGLYTIEIQPIKLVTDNSYKFEFTMPVSSAEGSYEVDVLGFNKSEELVAHKKLKFIVKKESYIERIKLLAMNYPTLYTITVILMAIIAGTIGGCILGCPGKNSAKKH